MIFEAHTSFLELLALCPNFQTFVDAADDTEAKKKIFFFRTDAPEDLSLKKFATINNDINFNLRRTSVSVGLCAFDRVDGCRFSLMSEYCEWTPENATEFMADVKGIVKDLITISGVTSPFWIGSLVQIAPEGLREGEDHFRWQEDNRKGYRVDFSVTRTSNA